MQWLWGKPWSASVTRSGWLASFKHQWHDVVAGALSFVGYLGTGHIPGIKSHRVPYLWIDRAVPLLPWTSYGYVSLYPLLLANLVYLIPRQRALRPLLNAIILANSLAGMLFVTYRTEITRPPMQYTHGWRILAFVWGADPPYNALPSLHTAYGVLIAWAHIKWRSPYLPVVLPWSAIVIGTTLTTKQHQAVDLVGGVALAAMIGKLLFGNLSPADLLPTTLATAVPGSDGIMAHYGECLAYRT